jgi:hypothetical protein
MSATLFPLIERQGATGVPHVALSETYFKTTALTVSGGASPMPLVGVPGLRLRGCAHRSG